MAVARVKTGREAFLEEEDDFFRRNALLIIKEMVEMNNPPSVHTSMLMDEVLHAIFFLGKIHNPPYPPEKILNDENSLSVLRQCYPRPFKLFSCQLPRRSPFSCVLDMIVHVTGEQQEHEIMKKLQKLILKLKVGESTDLISSTICVSQSNSIQDAVRYYGVSMSTSGPFPGRIIIAAACLSNWDSYVADAVMTYYPKKEKKTDFDGTIKLPQQIRCQAYSLSTLEPMPACESCRNLFGLTIAHCTRVWAYGNCAEAESISNMLKNETDVREQVQQTSVTCTDVNRERAKQSVLDELKKILGHFRKKGFKWDGHYYTPQVSLKTVI